MSKMDKASSLVFVISLWCLVVTISAKVTPKLLGSFHVPNAAFVGISKNSHQSNVLDQFNVLISGFNAIPLSSDHVYEVAKIGRHLASLSSVHPTLVTSKVTWPNEVEGVSESVFGKEMISIAGGFLVPLKTHGTISLYDTSSNPPKGPYYITNNHGTDANWFYHRVVWKDMDGDGDMDCLTARAEKPILGSAKGQLLWFENPGKPLTEEFKTPWTAHILANGPDVYFKAVSLRTSDGKMDAIITAGFFSESIQIFWTTDSAHRWTTASKLHSKVIEKSIGAVFDVDYVDLNNDGKEELLVTTNKQSNAAIYAYEVPDDFRTGTFTRHVLASGFHARFNLFGHSGALGSAYAIPEPVSTKSRPVIILSGDDDGKAYILESQTQAASNWKYTTTAFLGTNTDTVGEIAYADVDGDGHVELFVPDYSKSIVYVYTLKPGS